MQISHRAIQHLMQKLLIAQEVWIEKPFPTLHRIADIVWPAARLVFEVQCSPITVKEIYARQRAYRQEGYRVIWLLYDGCFNRTQLVPGERCLLAQPHYFVTMTAEGEGRIYSQRALLWRGKRRKQFPPLPCVAGSSRARWLRASRPPAAGWGLSLWRGYCRLFHALLKRAN